MLFPVSSRTDTAALKSFRIVLTSSHGRHSQQPIRLHHRSRQTSVDDTFRFLWDERPMSSHPLRFRGDDFSRDGDLRAFGVGETLTFSGAGVDVGVVGGHGFVF